MNPLLIKAIAALALLGAAVLAVEAIPAHYIAVGVQQEKDARKASDDAHLLADTAATLEHERLDREAAAKAQTERLKREQDHEIDKAAAVARARAGLSGMRCPSAPLLANTTSTTATPVSGPGDASGQPLVPSVAGDILDIAAGIAASVRRYNDLLAEDAAVRAACKSVP